MEIFFITASAAVFTVAFYTLIDWSSHIVLTKERSTAWGWGSYKTFKREFDRLDREGKIGFSSYSNDGVFGKGWNSEDDIYVFATVVIFENKGMVIRDPISYQLTRRYTRNYIKRNSPFAGIKEKENRVKW